MSLKLYNTLTRQKAEFVPIDPNNVRMYVCGPTVYDFAHIGNARPVIVFDVLFRLLRHIYGPDHVTYVRNITDVDDKINARAASKYPLLPLNDAIRKVTTVTEEQFHADIAALGVLPPTYEPRATEYIRRGDGREDMTSLIEKLIARGNAYVAADHVLFDVSSMPDYGRLSNRSLDEMEAGARVEVAPYKKGPMDFVLWKPSKPGEPSWPSPAGIAVAGRPGWHIECSAMAGALLGPVFDIHGGGIDLTFPHHENEIAQSRCAHGTPMMANVWMHNGFLQVEGEKMSKSLGNFLIINALEQKWCGPVLRLQMLNTHYRQPIDWTESATRAADREIEDWVIKITDILGAGVGDESFRMPVSPELLDALFDDLNTPAALGYLRRSFNMIGNYPERAATFLCDCEFLGLLDRRNLGLLSREFGGEGNSPEFMVRAFDIYQDFRAKLQNKIFGAAQQFEKLINELGAGVIDLPNGGVKLIQRAKQTSDVEELIAARLEARKRKDFKESDRIREELAAMGIALKDTKNKETGEIETTWEVAR